MFRYRLLEIELDKPDPDTIKMFVGQVPHDMEENDLQAMFEEFGRVHQINVLRNKYTGSHQGNKIQTHILYTRKQLMIFWNGCNYVYVTFEKYTCTYICRGNTFPSCIYCTHVYGHIHKMNV